MAQAITFPAVERYSLHKIHEDKTFTFDPYCYSRFRFGDERCSERMGQELADGFVHQHFQDIPPEGLAVAVCYEAVPTAAYFLRKHFVIRLNEHLAAHNLPPCQEAHIQRVATFYQDFGKMSAAQRAESLDKDDFQLVTDVKPSKALIYLDDIRITGTHERKMLSILHRQQIPNKIRVVYFAELIATNVDPTLENTLNYFSFPTLADIAKVPRCGYFTLNARFTKHLLNQSREDFSAFLRSQDSRFSRQLYDAALADRWDKMPKFADNLAILAEHVAAGERLSSSPSTESEDLKILEAHDSPREAEPNEPILPQAPKGTALEKSAGETVVELSASKVYGDTRYRFNWRFAPWRCVKDFLRT